MYLLFSVYIKIFRFEWFIGHSEIFLGDVFLQLDVQIWWLGDFGRVASKSSNLIYYLVYMFYFAKNILGNFRENLANTWQKMTFP